ncbi:M36 family metallopeptidase, partial [Aureisphaera sp.]
MKITSTVCIQVLCFTMLCFVSNLTTAQNNSNGKSQITALNTNEKKESNQVSIQTFLANQDSPDFVVTASHVSSVSGIEHTYIRQAVNGIGIIGTESSVHKDKNGNIIKEHNNFVRNIQSTVRSNTPGISASEAINSVAQQMGYAISGLQELERSGSNTQKALFNKAGISATDIPVELAYFYQEGLGTTLVWQLSVEELDSSDWWEFLVNASTGAIISQMNYTVSCFNEGNDHNHNHGDEDAEVANEEEALFYTVENNPAFLVGSYNVIAMPDESPQHGSIGRQVVVDPDDAVASPFGWHDTDGVAGAESEYTIGNNTDAYDDSSSTVTGTGDGDDTERAFGGPTLTFSDPFNTNVTVGDGSIDAAVTNLFYWANIIHDVTYHYGFDEASGNFQVNNYGNGGVAGDSVRSEAQDGSGTCNANFATPADGGRGRMQMYVCNTRDGDFDNGVIAHEYGHGISNRLTGGAGNAGCLNRFTTPEQMGEGWSDFYGLLLTMEVGDTRNDSRGIGTWLVGQAANGPGIRPTPYSTDFSVNGTTYSALPSSVVPHGVGYVWATMLWELTWDLIDDQGFDTDFYNGTGGNNIALNLVTEGMKLQPCSPGFVDGRDAILAADAAIYGGAYNCLIWEAFARRGLGFSASQGNSSSIADGSEAFDLPPGLGSPTLDTVSSVCLTSGVQTGLGGGTPVGGVYSGIGVTDDGNGTTYTFDPSIGGVGTTVVSYTITNICTSSVEVDTDSIIVGDGTLNIVCPADITTCYPEIDYEFPRPSDGCFGRTSNRVSQNNNELINNGVDCAGDTSGHLRRFNLTTEGVARDYLITGIDVGINTTTGANITVNIYLDNTIDNAITTYTVPISDTVTPYATAISAVPSGSGFVHTVPFDVFLPAGTAFTVEVISPSTQDFMIGYNDSGTNNVPDATATGYTSCSGGLAYSDLIAFDLGENAVLIQVQGTESDSLTTTQTAGLPPGETFSLGTTTNTFETTDGSNTESCSFDVNVLGNSVTTYTGGAWNNGTPTTTAVAVFEDAYDTSGAGNSSIDACLCEVNSGGDLTVAAGDYLNVQTDVIVNSGGLLTVAHTGSVVQTNDTGVATNNGTINVNLTTPNLASRDFMVLGSPMSGETRESVWSSAFLVLEANTVDFVPHPDVTAL